MFTLGELLGNLDWGEIVEFPELSVGYYSEKDVWNYIQPNGPAWNIKNRRPFIVIKATRRYVYMILLTTLDINPFPCKGDDRYGIGYKLPVVFLKECDIEEPLCGWLNKESHVFKRKVNGGECKIVIRISRKILANNSVLCGRCSENVFNEHLRFIIDEEIEGWRQRNSENL